MAGQMAGQAGSCYLEPQAGPGSACFSTWCPGSPWTLLSTWRRGGQKVEDCQDWPTFYWPHPTARRLRNKAELWAREKGTTACQTAEQSTTAAGIFGRGEPVAVSRATPE